MATVANDAEEIRRQMALIRRELHHDVRQVVDKAEAVADWHRYIRLYPWISLGVAVAVGYVVVPKRRVPRHAATAGDVAELREAVQEARQDERLKEKTKTGLLVTAWAALSPIAIRLAQGYAVQFLENWLLQQQQAAAGPPPGPQPEPSPRGWSGGTRRH